VLRAPAILPLVRTSEPNGVISMLANAPTHLDPQSAAPLHAQLAAALREQLRAGTWAPGALLPSERHLVEHYRISRATVRHALDALERDGLVRRVPGRGTIVRPAAFEQPLHAPYSFFAQLAQLGLRLEDQPIQQHEVSASEAQARALGIAPGSELIHIQRVRSLEGVPFTLDNCYLIARLCPELRHTQLSGSLYQWLSEARDLPVVHCTDTLTATVADRAMAAVLDVMPGAPLMRIERIAYTRGDLPLHLAVNNVRGDRCRFRVALAGAPAHLEYAGVRDS
jgi:GntR family transcriptional regulator